MRTSLTELSPSYLGCCRPGDLVGLLQVGASYLNIDRSRFSLIDHRIHEASGLEVGTHIGKIFAELLADLLHVNVASGLVVLFQADLDKCSVHSRVGGIDRGQVRCNADVRDDHV